MLSAKDVATLRVLLEEPSTTGVSTHTARQMLDTIDQLVETLRRLDSERKAQGEEPCSYCYGDSWAGPHKEGCELAAMLKLKK